MFLDPAEGVGRVRGLCSLLEGRNGLWGAGRVAGAGPRSGDRRAPWGVPPLVTVRSWESSKSSW